jgi:branched-chain amino acid transport system permease protein
VKNRLWPVYALVGLGALAFPRVLYPIVAIDLVCFALFAVSFDLLFGFVGLLSFGQAMFWGGSGYVVAIVLTHLHVDAAIAVLGGVLYSLILSLIVGALAVRRAGIYFAMITLAIAQIQYFTVFVFGDLTGGENGLPLNGRGTFFGLNIENDSVFYYLTLAIAVLAVLFVIRATRSPFGQVLRAMRQNEPRAIALGYRVNRYKLAVFVIAGSLSGLAGALYVLGNRLGSPEMVDWHTSGAVVIMALLGGSGTIVGPAIGAGVYQSLDYFVSKTPIGEDTNLVMGVVFALSVLLFRRGIVGQYLALTARKNESSTPP